MKFFVPCSELRDFYDEVAAEVILQGGFKWW
jgi:hypothetical protein